MPLRAPSRATSGGAAAQHEGGDRPRTPAAPGSWYACAVMTSRLPSDGSRAVIGTKAGKTLTSFGRLSQAALSEHTASP